MKAFLNFPNLILRQQQSLPLSFTLLSIVPLTDFFGGSTFAAIEQTPHQKLFFLPKTRQFPAKFNLSYDKLKTCHQLSKYGQLKMWVIRAEISSRLQRSFLQLRFFVRSRSLKLLKNCLSRQVTQATSQVKMRLCQEII